MFSLNQRMYEMNKFRSWAVVGTVVGIVAGVAAVAGVSYQIYSAENPPKTPKQASQALNHNQVQLGKLQSKLSDTQAAGKDTTKIQDAITKVQGSISFLNQWLAQHGDTVAPKTPEGNFASITDPIGGKTNSGAPQPVTNNNKWLLIAGIVGAILAIGFLVYGVIKKKNK